MNAFSSVSRPSNCFFIQLCGCDMQKRIHTHRAPSLSINMRVRSDLCMHIDHHIDHWGVGIASHRTSRHHTLSVQRTAPSYPSFDASSVVMHQRHTHGNGRTEGEKKKKTAQRATQRRICKVYVYICVSFPQRIMKLLTHVCEQWLES